MPFLQRTACSLVFFFLLSALLPASAERATGQAVELVQQDLPATDRLSGAERILLFDSQAELAADGLMTVTETIRFLVRGKNIKRGIIRDLPLLWKRKDGRRFRLGVTVLSVQRNGNVEPYSTERTNDLLAVRIGDPWRDVPQGIQEYRIVYTASNHFSRFDDWDELYWNVTGNDWEFAMDSVRFSLRFTPGLADAGRADAADSFPSSLFPFPWKSIDVYTGLSGEKGNKAEVNADGSIVSTEPLRAKEGLTVAYTWSRAILADAPAPEEDSFLWRLLLPRTADPITFVYWLVPLLLLFHCGQLWKRRRGGGARTSIIPLFAPPDGVSPGRLRHVLLRRYDDVAFASDLLHIMARGGMRLLRPEAEENRPSFWSRLSSPKPVLLARTPGKLLSREETKMLETLFDGESTIDLGPVRQKSMHKAFAYRQRKAVEAGKTLFHSARKSGGKGGWIFLLFPVMLGLTVSLGAAFFCLFFGIIFTVLAVITLPKVVALREIFSLGRFVTTLLALAFISVFWFAFGMLCYHLLPMVATQSLPEGFVGALAASLLIVTFARFVIAVRTREGEELRAAALGLRLYMKTAERKRFEFLYPPSESVEHFERLLPYALALDVGRTWANQFEHYLGRSGEGAQHFSDMHSWSRLRSFSGASAAASAAATARGSSSSGSSGPSGSGSSGGGSSGGGSGGGGGRGW